MELIGVYENLVDHGKVKEAAEFLESALHQYPDYICEITSTLAETYVQLGDFDKALTTYERGLSQRIFYSIHPHAQEKIPFEYTDRFTKIENENNRLKELAQAESKAKYEVVEPAEYSGEVYPLFIILHGGGSSIEIAKMFWKSEMLHQFLRGFIQSSEVDSSVGFTWWKRIPQGREDIKECYSKIIDKYPVDTEKIIIGGFSVGGSMAIDCVLNNIIPVKGFIGGCPGKPERFNKEKVEKAAERNIKGVMIGGENDYYRKYQEEMAEVFKETGFNHHYIVIPGLGHGVPQNYSELIDEAITYIMSP